MFNYGHFEQHFSNGGLFKGQSHQWYDRLPTTHDQNRCRSPKTIGEHWPPKNGAVTPNLTGD